MRIQREVPFVTPLIEDKIFVFGSRATTADYHSWLKELKVRIHAAQQRATLSVNRELIQLYWQIGHDILSRQGREGWGAKVIYRLSLDLQKAFPDLKGFSRANLMYMRAFAEAWPDLTIFQQVVGQLPWGHNLVLLTKLKIVEHRLAYAKRAIQDGWSRDILSVRIAERLLEREGKAVNNFDMRHPIAGSDQVKQLLKDPYLFSFLGVDNDADEKAIEDAIERHITRFLLELGAGFAFIGRQVLIKVGNDEFFIDLLFYHLKLRCYVVVELKAGAFRPEHTGQLSFYLSAVDAQMKTAHDNMTIGLLLCKRKNKVVAEYALRDLSKPIGIAEYLLIGSLPAELQLSLPSIEAIEQALADERSTDGF